LRFQALHPFHRLRPERRARLPSPHRTRGGLPTTRQASLDAADPLVAGQKGLLTLRFDPTGFQTEPPACYRASWPLPGTGLTSAGNDGLLLDQNYISTSNSGRARKSRYFESRLAAGHPVWVMLARARRARDLGP
jgi:hypothetical protein